MQINNNSINTKSHCSNCCSPGIHSFSPIQHIYKSILHIIPLMNPLFIPFLFSHDPSNIHSTHSNIQILYENHTEEETSEFAYSLNLPPSLINSLMNALQSGKECSLEVDSLEDNSNGVMVTLFDNGQTLCIGGEETKIVLNNNPFKTEVATPEVSLTREPYLSYVFGLSKR